MTSNPPGVRLCNPCNVTGSRYIWDGQKRIDASGLVDFAPEPINGARAAGIIFLNRHDEGKRSVREYVTAYARPVDTFTHQSNNLDNYVKTVAGWLNVAPDAPFDITDEGKLADFLGAVSHWEQGGLYFSPEVFKRGAFLALSKKLHRPPIATTKFAKATGIATVGAVASIAKSASDASHTLEPFRDLSSWVGWVCLGLTIVGLAFGAWEFRRVYCLPAAKGAET